MNTTKENACSINDDWTYKGMKVVFLENRFLRIGILVDRGSDIFEFRYKPADLDPLLRLPKGIRNPQLEKSQLPNPSGQFEEHYYGGWQEALPNSPAFNYRGSVLGQHGEVALVPWKYSILKDTPEEVQLKVSIDLLRMPLRLEKIFSLKKEEPTLIISENLTNLGGTHLDIMWGHHIAFGLPFLKEGAEIETNAKTYTADPGMPHPRRFAPGKEFSWPQGENQEGKAVDGSKIPDVHAKAYSELCYLEGYPKEAYYRIFNRERNIGFELNWQGDLFKCLWQWQERYSTQDFPWWGDCYTVALEPWTSAGTDDPEGAIAKGEWLKILPGEVVGTELRATIFSERS